MEYSGWTLYDTITLVIKHSKYQTYEYPQAYLVNPKNKKQLETAIAWGTERVYELNKETGKNEVKVTKPDVVTVKNDNFTIQLLDSANSSCQGGKLSFWNCIITNEEHNIAVVVGIDANLLLNLLLQNEFSYGVCKLPVEFARMAGGVGVLTKNMKEYQEAVRDMETKKSISKKKTSKWQLGKSYKTLTIDDVYMGKLYKPFDLDYVRGPANRYTSDYYKLALRYDKKPNRTVIVDTSKLAGANIHKLSELKTKIIKVIDKNYAELDSKASKSKDPKTYISAYYLLDDTFVIQSYNLRELEKFPARQQGEFELEIDIDIDDFYKYIINHVQNRLIQIYDKYNGINISNADDFILRTDKFTLDDLNENEKRILDMVKADKDILYRL